MEPSPILAAERERRVLSRDAATLEAAAAILRERSAHSGRWSRLLPLACARVLAGAAKALREAADLL